MVYTRFVEVGRVVLIQRGEHKGKLAVIVEIIDQNRAVVDCPSTEVPRHVAPFRHMLLTKMVVERLPRSAGSKVVQKRFEEQGIAGKWAEGETAKKAAQKVIRANLNDFDRFKVMVLQKKRSHIIKA